jgi:TRAP transporter TAXI family solute receptor
MKKVVIVALIAVMAAFSFVSVASAANFMSIATGGTTGTYYAVGGAIANAVTKAGKVQVTAETGNASVANVNLVNTKGIELAFTQADIAYWAYNGQLMFQGKPLKNLRAVCALYPEHIQVIVTKDAKMKKFTDIKGKRVGVGAPGSGVEGDVQALFKQAGLTYKDLAKADFLDFAATTSRFKDNQIDVGFVVAGFPTASVMDLLTTKNNITLFSFDDAFLKALNKTYPFMVPPAPIRALAPSRPLPSPPSSSPITASAEKISTTSSMDSIRTSTKFTLPTPRARKSTSRPA